VIAQEEQCEIKKLDSKNWELAKATQSKNNNQTSTK